MPSDSVASFLDRARETRLLTPDEIDDLARRPDAPRHGLAALCDFLQAQGALTPFQVARLRAGRGDDLAFAGYALTDELGPCPGGTAFRALHPSLRTPLVLRRLRADRLAPADDPAGFVRRAKEAAPVTHPHLAHLLDAGVERGEPFAVLEPFAGADLDTLVRDIGPMPTALACGFAWQAAAGLRAAHAGGLAHGDIRPANVHVGPLVESSRTRPDGSHRRRPASAATAKVFELGLVPRRPAAALTPDELAFLPPERLADADATPAGDVYGLGTTLFFLLTGRPPVPVGTAEEMAAAVRAGESLPLKDIRPDVPAELAALVGEMLAADPAARPTAAAVVDRLAPFGTAAPPGPAGDEPLAPLTPAAEPAPVPLTAADPTPLPGQWVVAPYQGPEQAGQPVYAVEAAASDPFASADAEKSPFAPPSTETPAAPRAARTTVADRGRLRMWFLIGAAFWGTAFLLWGVLLNQAGCFGGQAAPPEDSSGPKQHRR